MHSRRRVALVVAALLTQARALDVILSERRGSGAAHRWRVGERITPLTTQRPTLRSLKAAARDALVPSTTVAPEYARYQCWHVAQDLSTQLRSTLATSAVFQGLGMGSGSGATALAATVAWLSRDASGMVASLAATARLAPRLDGDCRRWRFVGDVCVDAALVLELATPHAPRSFFVPMICAASVLKALCGVLAGGANAAVSAHWAASSADFAEVQAKGAAVGTLSGLLGLGLSLAGAGLASRGGLGGVKTAWTAFGVLTALHVVCCAAGLKILRLRRLGCARRFYLAVDCLSATGRAPTPAELAARDRVIGAPDKCQAAGAESLLRRVRDRPARLDELLREARGRYVCVPGRQKPVIGLLSGATPRDERAALLHARRGVAPDAATLDAIDGALGSAGFDLDARLFPAGGPVLDVEGVVDE